MARVALVDPDKATGRAKEVFDRVKSYYHMVPDLHDLALIDILAGSAWVAGRIVVKHPCGRLDHSVAEPI